MCSCDNNVSPIQHRATAVSPLQPNLHVLRLLVAQRKTVAAKAELDRIAQGGAPDHFYAGAVAEAHFQKAPADFRVAADGDDAAAASDAQGVERTGRRVAAVITSRQIARLVLHDDQL